MMTKYELLAAEATPGTAGADPAFWERMDQARAIVEPLAGAEDILCAVEVQPLPYVAFLLADGADALDALAERHTLLSVGARAEARERAVQYRAAAEAVRSL